MKWSMIVLKILFVGALLIIGNQNLHLSNSSERAIFIDMYSAWVGSLMDQGLKVSGYVIKFEWLPPKNTSDLLDLVDSRNNG